MLFGDSRTFWHLCWLRRGRPGTLQLLFDCCVVALRSYCDARGGAEEAAARGGAEERSSGLGW